MKRSAALAPLSRDHQHALDAALRLRRATPETVHQAIERFLDFFAREGAAHFAIEEQHLLGVLPADEGDWSAAVARVREDHAAIRRAAAELADAGTPVAAAERGDHARRTGERLAAHVHFEERTLFALLEERLPAGDLARLGERVAAAEAESARRRPAEGDA